jgi:TRAP transporter TAXI family solute receptor
MQRVRFAWRLPIRSAVACLLLAGFASGPASAQTKTVIIGTLGTGTINYAGAVALADLLNKEGGLRASVLPQTGVPALIALLKDGAIQIATVPAPESQMANTGTLLFEGQRQPLRLLHPFYSIEQGLLAAGDSGIKTGKDVRGRKVVGRYTGDPGLRVAINAHLANHGLTEKDVTIVPVSGYVDSVKSVIERRADLVASGLTSPLVQQLHAARGFVIVPADNSPEAVARTKRAGPGFNVVSLPRTDASMAWLKNDPNLGDSITLLQYWYYLVALPSLDEDIAYAINKTVWQHFTKLASAQIKFARDWRPENMLTANAIIPYHPGAVRWFMEAGKWSDADAKNQQQLMAAEPK